MSDDVSALSPMAGEAIQTSGAAEDPLADLLVEGLSVRYGHVSAVRSISLRVSHGEVVAVLGANGAG